MNKTDKIYVAGHTGLVGSAIVRKLKELGFYNFLLPTKQQLDLRDQSKVEQFFYNHYPDYVFMAAAKVGGIVANRNDPYGFLLENLQIQTNVISTARRHGVRKLLFVGSSCIYPRDCPQPIKEDYLLTGPLETTNEAYAIAKIAGVKLCQAAWQTGQHFVSVMPTNLYGPGDHFDPENSHFIPGMIRRFHEAKVKHLPAVTLWGTGRPLREVMYVDDLADALILVMNEYESKEPINIGVGEDRSILEYAHLIKDIVGYTGSIEWDSHKPDGTPRKLVDSSKLDCLGYTPKTSLEAGLKKTYDWFLNHHPIDWHPV